MAKRNDFMEGFLKGLYSSGVGNPEVQRANEADTQNRNAALTAKMAEQGMVPNTLPNDHPIRSAIGGLLNTMVGNSSTAPMLASSFRQDPTQPQYGMDDTGKMVMAPPGSPLPMGLKRMPPKQGETSMASQWRDQNATPAFSFAGTDAKGAPVKLNTHTGEFSTGSGPMTGPILSKTNPTDIQKEIKDIDIQASQLVDVEKLLKGIPSSALGGVQSVGSTLTGGLYAPKAKQYNAFKPSFAVKIYRAATGDTRLSDADAAARAYPMVPDLSDSEEVRAGKLTQIKALLDNRKRIISSGQGTETPWPMNATHQTQGGAAPQINSQSEYDALPIGASYIDSHGTKTVKR